ncbi:hypothetical protein K458DRAFT_489011 [Lentithecium fluviatile CBS 122367]|uniref:Uncharacterized protein n=1 Tax=Lentithecium fluviatile CBS 122367 TaxID=1168545 RepID=A0A6G1IUJ8_9PLEO|nr:hypothetical protein K458DRAFT_489011 [Lentithecium fluviatile CBS 122367]
MRPSTCFQSYIDKRTQSVAAERTDVPNASPRSGRDKLISWLFGKTLGHPVPATSAEMIDQQVKHVAQARIEHPISNSTKSMRDLGLAHNTSLGDPELHSGVMTVLFQKAFDHDNGSTWSLWLCRSDWVDRTELKHCWAVMCREVDSWHCGKCGKCMQGRKMRCIGCGGVSGGFGEGERKRKA